MTPASIVVSAASGTYAFSGGPIDGSGSLTKSGAGGLTLNAANTFNGGLYIKAGTVTLQNGGSSGDTHNRARSRPWSQGSSFFP